MLMVLVMPEKEDKSMNRRNYQHIEKINFLTESPDLAGLFNGETYVYPKIDGCNCLVRYDEINRKLVVGGRNRDFDGIDKTDRGLLAYVKAREKKFLAIFEKLGPNATIYGEWLVPHTIKYYRLEAWNEYYIFDILLFKKIEKEGKKELVADRYLDYEEYSALLDEVNRLDGPALLYIPCLGKIKDCSLEQVKQYVEEHKDYVYLTKEGDLGEGLIFKNYQYHNAYNRVVWGKVVFADFLQIKKDHRKMKANLPKPQDQDFEIEPALIGKHFNVEFAQKEKCKFEEAKGQPFSMRQFGELLFNSYHEFIKDNIFDFIKEAKAKPINFKLMQRLYADALKSALGY